MSNQEPQMSRRDWFRLRTPQLKPTSQSILGSNERKGLQSIEEPVNHGGVDLSSLPPIHEAILDAEEVTSLFSDIEQHATAVHFVVARSVPANAPDQSERLSEARDRLFNGKVKKLQIRYQWDSTSWIDTLESLASGFRLVRIQHVVK